MNIKKQLLVIIFFCISYFGFAQIGSYSDLKSRFKDAEYDFSQEDYYLALSKYSYCYRHDSLNANVNFCVGVCYMKTAFEKTKSIPYFEKAVKDVTKDYKDGTYDEKKARQEAFLYLGQAYRLNNELDKALDALSSYKKLLSADDKKNNIIVDNEIQTCKIAKDIIKKQTVSVGRNNISDINSAFSDYSAVFSADENLVVFVNQQLEGKSNDEKKLMMSRKIDGKWLEPSDISSVVKSKGNMCPTYLSPDGKYMLLAENDDSKTALFESKWIDAVKDDTSHWSAAKKLNGNINKGKVTHASLSPDGKTMYFTSDRKEGLGGLDIYMSAKEANGDWGKAVNLGPKINSPFDEETPFMLDNKTLYFSSDGHRSIGGLDIFHSTKNDKGEWSEPINMGYSLNTTDDNYFYVPILDGNSGFMALTGDDATGERDIYKVNIFPYKDEVAQNTDNTQQETKNTDAEKDAKEKAAKEAKEKEEREKAARENEQKAKEAKDKANKDKENKTKNQKTDNSGYTPAFAIQLATSNREENPMAFASLGAKEVKCKDSKFRYIFGDYKAYGTALNNLERARNAGFKSAFIIDYAKFKEKYIDSDNNITDINAKLRVPKFFSVQIASSITLVDVAIFKNLGAEIKSAKAKNGYTRYHYGKIEGYKAALIELNKARSKGYVDAFLIYCEE